MRKAEVPRVLPVFVRVDFPTVKADPAPRSTRQGRAEPPALPAPGRAQQKPGAPQPAGCAGATTEPLPSRKAF